MIANRGAPFGPQGKHEVGRAKGEELCDRHAKALPKRTLATLQTVRLRPEDPASAEAARERVITIGDGELESPARERTVDAALFTAAENLHRSRRVVAQVAEDRVDADADRSVERDDRAHRRVDPFRIGGLVLVRIGAHPNAVVSVTQRIDADSDPWRYAPERPHGDELAFDAHT